MTRAGIGDVSLPDTDRLAFDASHVKGNRASGSAAWYDAFPLSETRYAVTIGTVATGELEAATLMHALRALGAPGAASASSAALLSAADAVLRRLPVCTPGTALVGIVDCVERTFTYLSRGEPPPYVRYRNGRVMALPALGAGLGQGARDCPPAQVEADLDDVALLVLSSGRRLQTEIDVEATEVDGEALDRLRPILADERIVHCGGPAAWIASRMLDPLAPDGAALLTLAFPLGRATPRAHNGEPPSWKVSWSFDSTAAAANSVRRAFLACLSSKDSGGKAIDLAAAELIFGELLGNVVRHAPGPVDIALDWTGDLPVLHVLDSGPGFRSRRNRERLPVDDLSESGRGLFIVNACAKQFTVRNRNGRGTHATATLPAS